MNNSDIENAAVAQLPDHYKDTFGYDFLKLLAGLQLHGFSIQRADEAKTAVSSDEDLWVELSHPSVWIHEPSAPIYLLKRATPGSPEYQKLSNEVIRQNLAQQRRLLELLDTFYKTHTPTTFEARLIVETVDMGESNLRPQGASVRITLDDEQMQSEWAKAGTEELSSFADFLLNSHRDGKG